jgi:hypothetical protein
VWSQKLAKLSELILNEIPWRMWAKLEHVKSLEAPVNTLMKLCRFRMMNRMVHWERFNVPGFGAGLVVQ